MGVIHDWISVLERHICAQIAGVKVGCVTLWNSSRGARLDLKLDPEKALAG